MRLAAVGQIGLRSVANEKQVAQHFYRIALLAFAQQGRHRNAQMLPQQIEQGRFNRRDGVNCNSQIKGLQAPPTRISVGKARLHGIQNCLGVANVLPHHQLRGILQRGANFFAPRHLTHAGVARTVGQDQ